MKILSNLRSNTAHVQDRLLYQNILKDLGQAKNEGLSLENINNLLITIGLLMPTVKTEYYRDCLTLVNAELHQSAGNFAISLCMAMNCLQKGINNCTGHPDVLRCAMQYQSFAWAAIFMEHYPAGLNTAEPGQLMSLSTAINLIQSSVDVYRNSFNEDACPERDMVTKGVMATVMASAAKAHFHIGHTDIAKNLLLEAESLRPGLIENECTFKVAVKNELFAPWRSFAKTVSLQPEHGEDPSVVGK